MTTDVAFSPSFMVGIFIVAGVVLAAIAALVIICNVKKSKKEAE